ncbi:MAG: type VI secretion system membrane subunit TssM, partial [Marinobacter sp.]|nr:type VI secretion system membrane subunit TssM [Marinobacter sp.]
MAVGRRVGPVIRSAGPVVLALGLGLMLAAVWWLGPRWQIAGDYPLASWQARSMITLGVVLLLVLVWGWVLSRKLRKVHLARADEKRQEEDPVLVYERRQQRLLDRSLAALKANLPGRQGVYKLPWYLVMGLEGAGKTSLMQRSGQTYTLTNVTRQARTEKNPLGFEWWVGDHGLLIDPDGELLSQGATGGNGQVLSNRLWQHFIQWLEKNRSRRPLNGVVLAIDIARLSTSTDEQRRQQAILLRTRLRELMEQLGSRLPVYIQFTKLDLLHGFGAFFSNLSKAERQQPFGFTFTLDGQHDPDDWLNQFDSAYGELVARLNDRVPGRLAATRDSEERAALYSFTRQLAGLRTTLLAYLTELLAADAFSTPALVRGTYFTSVYQEGVPEDAFVAAAAASYGLAGPTQPAQRGGPSLSYFTEQLFADIIYPEAGLAGDNVRVVHRRRRRVMTAAVLAIVAGLGMTAGWQHYFIKNADAARQVRSEAEHFIRNWHPVGSEPDRTGRNLLEPLDQLRDATLAFGDYRNRWPLVADMGLYQGGRVGPEVDQSYLNMLAYQFIPALMLGVMDQMSQAPDDGPERLKHLRVLRMLYDRSGRRDAIVEDYLANFWQQRFPGERQVQERLQGHLVYAMAHTDLAAMRAAGDKTARMTLVPFTSSVQWAQQELGRIPTSDRVYQDLETRAQQDLSAPLDLARAAGPAFETVFTTVERQNGAQTSQQPSAMPDLAIPGMLTRDGLQNYFLRKSDSVTELALIDAWVLGRRNNIDFSQADESSLKVKLQDRYAEDYVRTWRNALSQLDVRDFRDLNQGVRILDNLTGGHEPLTRLLTTVRDNTQLVPRIADQSGAAREALEQSPDYRMEQDIQRQFSGLNALLAKTGDEPTPLAQILTVVQSLHNYLRTIQESPDQGKAALAAARDRLSLQGADPIFTLQRLARNQPEPVNRMLAKLASESWRVVLNEAVAELERQWYHDVYQPF